MAQVQIKGFVHHSRSDITDKDDFTFFTFDATGSSLGYTLVGPAEFTYELPEAWNPTASKLASLAAQREKACREFADSVRRIDEQISKLTAIEFDGVAA